MSRDSRPSSPANATPDTRQRTGQFFSSVASLFESWVTRRKSAHTQRACREDVMSFVRFLGIEWPDQAMALFSVSVRDVLACARAARQWIGLPAGESVVDSRDRAILKTFLWSGIRLGTGCPLKISDFHQDGDEATIRLHEKGDKLRTIGLHFTAAQAISEYIVKAALTSGPLFRPRLGPRSHKLADRPLEASALYLLIGHYL